MSRKSAQSNQITSEHSFGSETRLSSEFSLMKSANHSGNHPAEISHYSTKDVLSQIETIQSLMKEAMKEGEHYGKIPGCGDKLVLLKPGAEKLAFMFRLSPTYEIRTKEFSGGSYGDKGHREYEVLTTLTHIPTGQVIAQGVGICSTLESKFRYRYIDSPFKPSQAESERLKAEGKGKWKKSGNNWIWQDKIEFDNVQDNYNTVLKMAKKRSFVDAILSATAASDIFTQDLEDFVNDDSVTENGSILKDGSHDKNFGTNHQPSTVDLNAKSNQRPLERNYSEEINKLNSIDELNQYYKKLNDKEKKNLMPLLKNRKEEILSSE